MTFSCNEQLAGFSYLDFFLLEETSNWPKILNDTNADQIIIDPQIFIEAEIDDDSISVSVKENRRDLFDITINFQFKTRSQPIEAALDLLKNKPGIVIAHLNSCYCKLYGTNSEPLYLSYEVVEGEKIEDIGATKVQIKGQTRRRPVFYSVSDSE